MIRSCLATTFLLMLVGAQSQRDVPDDAPPYPGGLPRLNRPRRKLSDKDIQRIVVRLRSLDYCGENSDLSAMPCLQLGLIDPADPAGQIVVDADSQTRLVRAICAAIDREPAYRSKGVERCICSVWALIGGAQQPCSRAWMLSWLHDPGVYRAAIEALVHNATPDVAREIVQEVRKVFDETDDPIELALLGHQAGWLGPVAAPLADRLWTLVADRTTPREARLQALAGLFEIQGPAAVLPLIRQLTSEDPNLIFSALGMARLFGQQLFGPHASTPRQVQAALRKAYAAALQSPSPEPELLYLVGWVFYPVLLEGPDGSLRLDPDLEALLSQVAAHHPDPAWRDKVAAVLDRVRRATTDERMRAMLRQGNAVQLQESTPRARLQKIVELAGLQPQLAALRALDPHTNKVQLLARLCQFVQRLIARLRDEIAVDPAGISWPQPDFYCKSLDYAPADLLDPQGQRWFLESVADVEARLASTFRISRRPIPTDRLERHLREAWSVAMAQQAVPFQSRIRRAWRLRHGARRLRSALRKPLQHVRLIGKQGRRPPQPELEQYLSVLRVHAVSESEESDPANVKLKWLWRPVILDWAKVCGASIFYARAATVLDDPEWDHDQAWSAVVSSVADDLLRGFRSVRVDALPDPVFQQSLAEALLWKVASLPPDRDADATAVSTEPAHGTPGASPSHGRISSKERTSFARLYHLRLRELRSLLRAGPPTIRP